MTDHHIGLIVPSSNLTMETELPRMLRAREEVHPGDRFVFHSSRMRMQHVTPEQLRAMNAQTERAALELADARPDVVTTACLVAIMAQGPRYHCTAEDAIRSMSRYWDDVGMARTEASSSPNNHKNRNNHNHTSYRWLWLLGLLWLSLLS